MVRAVPIQSIAVPSWTCKETPRRHYVYLVSVTLPTTSWTVERRFSDFVALHEALGHPSPPAPLPPREAMQHSWRALTGLGGLLGPSDTQRAADERQADARRAVLERYLRAIVAAADAHWRTHPAFLAFLETEAHTPAARPTAPVHAAPPPEPHTQPAATQAAAASLRPWRAPGARAPARDTDTTRGLSNEELLQHQTQTLMARQDEQAEQLARILRRQRDLGLAMNDELQLHTELLHELHDDVQATQTRMQGASQRMRRLEKR